MNELLRFAKAILPHCVFDYIRNWRADHVACREWKEYQREPRIPPPHEVKVRRVLEYAARFGIGILVETGTFRGEMVRRALSAFSRIYSIELNMKFWYEAQRRFRQNRHVVILQGKSPEKLRRLLGDLEGPALFWLDAHFSGGETAGEEIPCPLEEELRLVLAHTVEGHVILVDDARYLGTAGYPSYDRILQLVDEMKKGYRVECAEDIVRLTPRRINEG